MRYLSIKCSKANRWRMMRDRMLFGEEKLLIRVSKLLKYQKFLPNFIFHIVNIYLFIHTSAMSVSIETLSQFISTSQKIKISYWHGSPESKFSYIDDNKIWIFLFDRSVWLVLKIPNSFITNSFITSRFYLFNIIIYLHLF